jgi:hypothetical protein
MGTVSSSSSSSGGVGFCGLLTIVFIVLKLLGYINWSWWWVLAPMWIPISILLTIAAVAATIGVLVSVFGGKKKKKRWY